MEKKTNKKKYKSYEIAEIIIAIGIVVFTGTYIAGTFSDFQKFENEIPADNMSVQTEITVTETEPPEPEIPYDLVHKEKAEAFDGELVLVNNNYEYKFADNKDVLAAACDYKSDNYWLLDNSVYVRLEMIEAINALMEDFYAQPEVSETAGNIILLSGYRSVAKQGVLYNEDLEKTGNKSSSLVSKPGHSEHHTGYAVDFSLYENGSYVDYDGTGVYKWINDNSYKYGMILRYTVDKIDITGIQEEPWHFRYIGIPHAFAVNKSNMCYEEYINSLKNFSFENPYMITLENGEKYQTYYVPLEEKTAEVPVPKGFEYSISGNNIDGFIVTVNGMFNENYSENISQQPENTETLQTSETVTEIITSTAE